MARGQLRIYLGAAPGVGKTFAMLDEGFRRRERGTDVVVGYVETHGRAKTAEKLRDLEVVPRRRYEYRDAVLEDMDLDAILERRPDVVLVDELAHTNTPGCRHEKRWQDVDALLAAGIDVISTVNIQHLESVNDLVETITGVRQQETVPDVVVRRAEQVELVDMTPEALRRRMAHGNIYAAEKIDAALSNYFRPGNLAALRELALLWVADRVDESLQAYLEAHGIAETWETRERIVVAVTGAPGGGELIRRAARIATRTRGDLVGVHVALASGLQSSSGELERHRTLVRDLGGAYHEIVSDDPGRALVQFAHGERATQLVLGASRRTRWQRLVHGSVIDTVLHTAGELDVHVIASPSVSRTPTRPTLTRRSGVAPRRKRLGWVLGIVALPIVTLLLVPLRGDIELSTVLLAYLTIVVAAAAIGGAGPGVVTALAAFLLENFYFVPPHHTFEIHGAENVVSLVGFLAFAATISVLVNRLARRNREVDRVRAEAEALARTAGTLAIDADTLPGLIDNIRTIFGLDAVALLEREGGGWLAVAASGSNPPQSPDGGDVLRVDDDTLIVVRGSALDVEDRSLLAAFAGQAASVLETRRLRRDAAAAANLAQADSMRTGLLRAVSHDLRTPLAGIKASVTSLLQDDVQFDAAQERDFLEVIDEECDRLTRLVENLLDASRLQAGVVTVHNVPVLLDDVVATALASIEGTERRIEVELPRDLPSLRVDPDLLERILANIVANALRHSPEGSPVRVTAGVVADRVELLVIDRGPGIPASKRAAVLRPFQRLGDGAEGGIGLGLSIVHGFTELLGGDLRLEDTPGGGLTVVVSLPLEAELVATDLLAAEAVAAEAVAAEAVAAEAVAAEALAEGARTAEAASGTDVGEPAADRERMR
jgi:two-component system sensor histidine kinase KdpD